jgi:hypothetical protein
LGCDLPSRTRAKEYPYAFDDGLGRPQGETAQPNLFGGNVA